MPTPADDVGDLSGDASKLRGDMMTSRPADGPGGSFSPRFFLSADDSAAALSDRMSAADHGDPSVNGLDPGDSVLLSAQDSHHALNVLRMRVGDRCEVVGQGRSVYEAVVAGSQGGVQLTIVGRLSGEVAGPEYKCSVGLVQAITRPGVMEYALEKGTEVGADFFLLVQADGSPRHSGNVAAGKLGRWRRIVLEAAKQSKQTRVPWVDVAADVSEALSLIEGAGGWDLVLDPRAVEPLHELALRIPEGCESGSRAGLRLWVGPEGGWSAKEEEAFRVAGPGGARLGRSILRTETAGPVAVAVARLALQDW